MKQVIKSESISDLYKAIYNEIKENGNNCDLNHIDVSDMTDLSGLFCFEQQMWDAYLDDTIRGRTGVDFDDAFQDYEMSKTLSLFNGDISKWDVSNVQNMNQMFAYSNFNGDISEWNVINVKNIDLIYECSATTNIPYWAKIEDFEERQQAVTRYKTEKEKSNLNELVHVRPSQTSTEKPKFKI